MRTVVKNTPTVKTVKIVKTLTPTLDMNKKKLEKLAALYLIPDSVYSESIDKIKHYYQMIKLCTTMKITSPISSLCNLNVDLEKIYTMLEYLIVPLSRIQTNITKSFQILISKPINSQDIGDLTYQIVHTQLLELNYHLRMTGYSMLKHDARAGTTALFNTICQLRNRIADVMKKITNCLEEERNLEEMLAELDKLNSMDLADKEILTYEDANNTMDSLIEQLQEEIHEEYLNEIGSELSSELGVIH